MDNSSQASIPTAEMTAAKPRDRAGLYRYLATSEKPVLQHLRRLYAAVRTLSLPAPRIVIKPMLWLFLIARSIYYFCMRVFVCEPLFKAYCKQYGRALRTGSHIHFVQGSGDIILGDDVRIDGKCTFTFAARFADRPVLRIGDNCGIGHGCEFVVGRGITIGRNCTLSGTAVLFDSNGHRTDPQSRFERLPPTTDDVRPIVIGNGVWIGRQCLIFPGVRIGDGSVISGGSVVRTHVPPYSVVAGNPARVVFRLKRPEQTDGAASKA